MPTLTGPQEVTPDEVVLADDELLAELPEAPAVDETLAARIEAILLTSERPLSLRRIGETLAAADGRGVDEAAIEEAVGHLNEVYDRTGRSFRIERVAGGLRMMTRPEFGSLVSASLKARDAGRLSQAGLETLAIVAYRQPITRSDIEAIRGVACGDILRGLLERRLVKIVGRAEELGRPMLYGTGREFLEAFGLASLKDLPNSRELRQP
ncbi:MAG: SMC-Scp complex subunit ScpB [Phycisphaerales bacterium]|nr:SMC-Scp complex subunit ScpB [Phycisphaerales bacterium]